MLSVFDGPSRDHISVANRSGYTAVIAPGGQKLVVSLDTQSTMEKKVLWTASFGTAGQPPAAEFDHAANDWLRFEKPECKASNGRRTSFSSYEYDLTCAAADAPK
jgi:hypothetical protein